MAKKLKLVVPRGRWQFIAWFCQDMISQVPIEGMELASTIVAEMYERYLRQFTFRPTHLKLRLSEAMALQECLQTYCMRNDPDDPFVNSVIHELSFLIHANHHTVSRGATPPPLPQKSP